VQYLVLFLSTSFVTKRLTGSGSGDEDESGEESGAAVRPIAGYLPPVLLGTPSVDPFHAMNTGLLIAGHTIAPYLDQTGPPDDLDVLTEAIQRCSGIFVSSF